MAVSDRHLGGGGEGGRLPQVVGEPPALGVECGIVCPDLAMLSIVEGTDLKNVLRGLFLRAALGHCFVSVRPVFFCYFLFVVFRL